MPGWSKRSRNAEGAGPSGRLTTRGLTAAACWVTAAAAVAAVVTVRLAPAGAWPVHLLLYGPRGLAVLPPLALVPLASLQRLWRPALAAGLALVSAAGIWGVVTPGAVLLLEGTDPGPTLRVLTCNVQRSDLRVDDLAGLIRRARPEVVLLQECGPDAPAALFSGGGWHTRAVGEFCLASRYPITDLRELRRSDKAYRVVAVRAHVETPAGPVPVVDVHLMTPRSGLEAVLGSPVGGLTAVREVAAVQRSESSLLRRWLGETPAPAIVAGDFNLTAEHPLYRRDWSGYADAFGSASWGLGHTMFTRHIGLRIDHVLSGDGWRPVRCWVGGDVGSAHRPLIADLARQIVPAARDRTLRAGLTIIR
jgi:endonuclease/exonuclease/phosphatase (EEP) superfamily protein YafD